MQITTIYLFTYLLVHFVRTLLKAVRNQKHVTLDMYPDSAWLAAVIATC